MDWATAMVDTGTGTARGPLMPTPTTVMPVTVTAVPTDMATVITARGPLMPPRRRRPRLPLGPALMPMPTSMVPTPTPMALMVPTPTLMELTPLPMVPTTTARGPLMPTLTTDMVDTAVPTMVATDTAASATTDKRVLSTRHPQF